VESTDYNQWLAYQVLRGDQLNWKASLLAVNWESIEVQSEQLRSFVNSFLDIAPKQRRIRFSELEMAFQNNPIAFNRLSSFRPLLELDSVSTNSFTRDVQLLMQSVAKVLLEKPSEKKAGFEKIMAFVVREPAKWEAAAVHICTSIPEVNRIAPEFFRRIANHSTDLKRARLLERSAIRLTTLTRIRSRINDSRIINSTVVLYLLIMVLSAFIKFATNTVNKPTILPTTQSMESANSQKKVLRIRWDAAYHV